MARLHSETSYYQYNDPLFNFGQANHALEGAMFALLENGFSVDILNEVTLVKNITQYPLVVVPEAETVPDSVKTALAAYVQQGGRLLLTGVHVAEHYSELAGVVKAEGARAGGWLPAGNGAVKIAGDYQPVTLQSATELAPVLAQQEPALNRRDFAASTLNQYGEGRVAAIHGPIFRNYYLGRYPMMRRFIGDTVAALETPNLIQVHGPWFIEMAARTTQGNIHLQFVNRSVSGYLSPNRHIVEHVPDAGTFTVSVPIAAPPRRCYMAPEQAGLEWTWKAGVLSAVINGLHIHNILVIER